MTKNIKITENQAQQMHVALLGLLKCDLIPAEYRRQIEEIVAQIEES